jgi:hypothetical protein
LRALGEVAAFFVGFVICLFGFAMAFFVVYSDALASFRDPWWSFATLWKSMLGDSDMDSLVQANPLFGYLLYVMFTFITVFVLLTMLIAIISDSYNDIKAEVFSEEGERKVCLIFDLYVLI